MSFRITLDRSIFHGQHFDRLVASPLLKACRFRKITIYHTPILIEETLQYWLKPDQRDRARDHLRFIVDAANGRVFRQTGEIWTGEFEGKSQKVYLFRSHPEERILIDNLRQLADGGSIEKNELLSAMAEKESNFHKAVGLRKSLVSMREETARERKGRISRVQRPSFDQYYDSNWKEYGSEMIRKHLLTVRDLVEVIEMWIENPARYPYFTLWIKAQLYAMYYAREEQSAPIDPHTEMDVSILAMAKNLDAVISNELGFMKLEFRALYGTTKNYLTLDEFLARL
jgi:hypothetical protein